MFSNTGPCRKETKQHGGRENDDLQNWLDMTSPENSVVNVEVKEHIIFNCSSIMG